MQFAEMKFWLSAIERSAIKVDGALIAFWGLGLLVYKWRSALQ